MKGKKGVMFEGILLVASLIVAVMAITAVIGYTGSVKGSLSPPNEVMNFYSELDKFDYFHQEAGKLAIHESYASVLEKNADCKQVSSGKGLVAVWNATCGPRNDLIREEFIVSVKDNFNEITGKKQFKIAFESGKVFFTPPEIESEVPVISDFMKYTLSHQFYSLFSLESPDLDVEEVYDEVIKKQQACKSQTLFKDCVGALAVSGWETSVEEVGENVIFTLSSEKLYFYDKGFSAVELRFAIEKLS